MRTGRCTRGAAFARALLAALLASACGEAEPVPPEDEVPVAAQPEVDAEADQRAALEALGEIGYLGTTEEEVDAGGVLRHDPARALPGFNLWVCGHAPEALLTDMQGRVVHRWEHAFEAAFPDAPPAETPAGKRRRRHWRRAYLLEDGGLVAIVGGLGILRLDVDSNLVWASDVLAHHAAQVLGDELWVLTRENHTTPVLGVERVVAEDFVAVLDLQSGALLRKSSVLRAMEASPHRSLMKAGKKQQGDIFHTNSLQVLDGAFADRHPSFADGNVLLSARELDAVFVMDPEAERVVWARTGTFRAQHEPHLLDTGRILLFDNQGAEPSSRILELDVDPAAEHVVFEGSAAEPFWSEFCGAVSRLANGNTLVTETGSGRAFELDPAGDVVWEFVNPHGTKGKRASIYELVRVPPERLPAAIADRR